MHSPDARGACFDDATAASIVLREVDPGAREVHMAHAERCDDCLGRLAEATDALVSRGPSDDEDEVEAAAPGSVFGARYVILDGLGKGGMGIVYLAHDAVLGREVALKVMRGRHDHSAELLRAEARALAAVNHPNVVTVYDLVTDGDRLAVAMERVRGATLRHRIRAGLGRQRTVRALSEIGRGLAAAHRVGLVHGDVKLDNALVDTSGRACLADFGLARLAGAAVVRAGGTALYRAPELDDGGSSALADQFAFAASWVDALGAARPKTSDGWRALARRLRPRWARRPLARALDPDPARRHPSVASLLDHLRRRRIAFAAAAIALVVALAVTPWVLASAHAAAEVEVCVATAVGDLPRAIAPPALRDDAQGRATTAWLRGEAAYAAWRGRVVGLQRGACLGEVAPERAGCLMIEQRRMRAALAGLAYSDAAGYVGVESILRVESLARERMCDASPGELAALARLDASFGERVDGLLGGDNVFATTSPIAELDSVVTLLESIEPTRYLVNTLIARALVRQRAQDVAGADSDAARAFELATTLRQRELEGTAALALGNLAAQHRGDLTAAHFWARVARATGADSASIRTRRSLAELEANAALVSGRPREIIDLTTRLADDPIGHFALGSRLLALRGTALLEVGELALAEDTLRDSLARRLDEAQVDPARIGGALNNLASLTRELGDEQAADSLLRDAASLRAHLPEDHSDRLALDASRLRFDAEVFGRVDLERAEWVLRASRERFGDDNIEVIDRATLVADLAERLGLHERALAAASSAASAVHRTHLEGPVAARALFTLASIAGSPADAATAVRLLGPVAASAPLCREARDAARRFAIAPGPCGRP